MAKTIDQLTLLSTLPDDSDLLPISDNGVTKRVTSGVLKSDCLRTVSNTVTIPDATNFALNATTGTKLGTDATQKLAFWNATPVVQPANSTAIDTLLFNTGLRASGGSANFSTQVVANAGISVADAQNISLATGTGSKIGTATSQKLAFWNATPVVQPTAVTDLTVTATTGSLPTANGAVTIADAAAPTVAELLEYCTEIESKLEALLSRLRSLGIIAT
jgi:hypothetical protein